MRPEILCEGPYDVSRCSLTVDEYTFHGFCGPARCAELALFSSVYVLPVATDFLGASHAWLCRGAGKIKGNSISFGL